MDVLFFESRKFLLIYNFHAGLSNPVLCVEPSTEMLLVAESRGGLKPCCATADDFFTDHANDVPKCNKILINESAHLFPDLEGTLRKALEYLSADGLLVLIARSTQSTLPKWKFLNEKFTTHTVDEFKSSLVNAGFNVQMVQEVGVTKMTKHEWYDKLRKRMFTILYEFSDEQIEEGLKELDRDWFPGKEDSDVVDIRDSLQFYIASKD